MGRRRELSCPACGTALVRRVGKGYWCSVCSTPLVLRRGGLGEIKVRRSKLNGRATLRKTKVNCEWVGEKVRYSWCKEKCKLLSAAVCPRAPRMFSQEWWEGELRDASTR